MRFIIDFKKTTSNAVINAYLAANGLTVIKTFGAIGKIYLVEAEVEPEPIPEIDYLFEDAPNPLKLLNLNTSLRGFNQVEACVVADEDQWWKIAIMQGVDLDAEEFTFIRSGHGVRVYVVDSGFTPSHSEFNNRNYTLLHSVTDNFTDTTGHGTALASVISGNQCGITDAHLKIVKIFETGYTTLISDLLDAFDAIAADFLRYPNEPAVLNMSWAIVRNSYVEQKIASLQTLGLIAVAAAGNNGTPIADVTPAAMGAVFTVGSFGPDLVPSDFSNYTGPTDTPLTLLSTNYGVGLDLFSPGENIRVALPNGHYGYTAGTSIAAAIFSACIASNLTRVSASYQYVDKATLEFYFSKWINPELLTLSGNFANSPNHIPRLTVVTDTTDQHRTNIVTPMVYFKTGDDVVYQVMDGRRYTTMSVAGAPSWLTVDGVWLVGTAPPLSTNAQAFEMTVTASNQTETITYVVTVLVYDQTAYDDSTPEFRTAAAEAANVTLLYDPSFCGCNYGYYCCYCASKNNCIGTPDCVPETSWC